MESCRNEFHKDSLFNFNRFNVIRLFIFTSSDGGITILIASYITTRLNNLRFSSGRVQRVLTAHILDETAVFRTFFVDIIVAPKRLFESYKFCECLWQSNFEVSVSYFHHSRHSPTIPRRQNNTLYFSRYFD